MGLLAIHTLAAALETFFDLPRHEGKICCSNQGALFKSSERRRRIPVGPSQADIKRAFRNVKSGLKGKFTYEWVESHQDDFKLWHQLTLEQQLNCECDILAKQAVESSLSPRSPRYSHQRLPRESAAVFVHGIKQTSDVAKDVRFALGQVEAERFYTASLGERRPDGSRKKGGLGWSKASFHAVDWRALDATLDTKPWMYRQWLAKQSSGFCGTQRMVARWDSARDGLCPDCGKQERASHLCLCSNAERTLLFTQMADRIGVWLSNNFAHPELAYWIPRYIKLRGTRRLGDMPSLSEDMRTVAASQDLIPWRCFMEGKLSKEIFTLQRRSLARSPSRLTIGDWGKRLISQILQVSHGQWLFRNVSLHAAHSGYLCDLQRRTVLLEVDRLAQMDPAQLPEGSRYLLEIDFATLGTLEKQSYWLFAMRAAVRAGKRRTERARHATGGVRRVAGRRDQRQREARSQGTHDINTGVMSSRQLPETRRRRLPPRQRAVVAGAREALAAIEIAWGLRTPPPRTRPSPSVIAVRTRDNKRRKPD